MEADKAFHEEYKVKKKRQLLPYAAWRKRLTISVELVAISLIFMDEPTSSMQGLPPWLFLGHHIFKSVDEATEGVPDEHYPATWKLDVTTFSRKSKMSFDFAQTFDHLRCREQDQ
ncbi:unnamed protein product [Brassica napus]|uniref:Uncharacterized protein n=2 Tax=Brassica TaxID=3705 RepID=A0A3P6C5G4_BRAOL|nr:unnamed protein product [Brassica napus]VDD09518.1 unnamed protein product [Brassica oleracea]